MLEFPWVTTSETVKRRRRASWVIGILTVSTLVFLVFLQSSNFWKSFSIETASDLILLYILSSVNFIAFVIFLFILLRNLVKLARERRSSVLGAQIKTRLLMYFFAVSLLPIFAMAVFSYLFMNRALERWFSQIPQNVIREARDIEESSEIERERRVGVFAGVVARSVTQLPNESGLREIAAAAGVEHLQVIEPDGRTVAVTIADETRAQTLRDFAEEVKKSGTLQRSDDGSIGAVSTVGGRKVIAVESGTGTAGTSGIAATSLAELERLSQQQRTIRGIGMLTLGILTFLLISASSWIAFYIARGITTPIKALAEGADEISKGNLGYKVEVQAEDELALLVDAFNTMSGRLEESSTELEGRRKYIETLLQSLPTGVISITADGEVNTANDAARNILGLSDENAMITIQDLDANAVGGDISRLIARARRSGRASGQAVIGGIGDAIHVTTPQERTIAFLATALPDSGGVVLVLEDLTELISAQRASAWQEVARRMAHEIKNPLTPIQLSAERIAKRFDADPNGDAQIGSIVKESTGTILREVSSLKAMVDEFSRFARLPEVELAAGDINDVIRSASELYRERGDEVAISLDLTSELPTVRLDAEQLKRVFVNLIDNAIEAPGDAKRIVSIATRHDAAREIVMAEVSDNGDGIEPADLQKLFQPYFSTKGRGTGLGLAIVQRIISEHRGRIYAVGNSGSGAKFSIELPIAEIV
ncbi:MAG: HAMP domain-containing protein [Acidobacteriota bacterium]|nr:MAG: HAMP domain-containing protein [Acidobacteriota bacterium]